MPFAMQRVMRDCIISKKETSIIEDLKMDDEQGRLKLVLLHFTALTPTAEVKGLAV